MLKEVGCQEQTKLLTNGKEVCFTTFEQMRYGDFVEYAEYA